MSRGYKVEPCPFCGCKHWDYLESDSEFNHFSIVCEECHSMGPPEFCESEDNLWNAVMAWNSRADEKKN